MPLRSFEAARTHSPINRRQMLHVTAASFGTAVTNWHMAPRALAAENGQSDRAFVVEGIDRVTVRVPFRDAPRRAMDREIPHWRYSEIFNVHLAGGATGHGETLLYYTWGVSSDEDVERIEGKNAVELVWDDSLGAGLQMALFDAVAKQIGVPIHSLLGNKVNDRTPLSWWNIDMAADDMVSECQEALRQGYMAYKTKGRPWFDIWEQVEKAAAVVPESFKIDMDFNDTLLDADRAIPILKDLERFPQIDIYETPIPQGDIAGNKRIREATRVKIAMHYGNPAPVAAIREQACDGFVVGGGASRVMHQGAVAAMADMPFWLQLVGTGITAAYSLHFGAVLSHAKWPAVNCHQLYTHSLLKQPIIVRDGFADIPSGPGLGCEIDWEAVKSFQVKKPPERPEPERMIETSWPDGRKMYIANNGTVNFMLRQGMRGVIPFYERGVTSRLVPDDGSSTWREIYGKARREPYLIRE